MWGRTSGKYKYKEWENMKCFENSIVVSGSILCNIFYCIMKWFSFIRGRRHGWPNHVKTSCIICMIVLSLCSWINLICMKASVVTTKTIKTKCIWLNFRKCECVGIGFGCSSELTRPNPINDRNKGSSF